MGRIVGIDLGTTNTAVAVIQEGRPRVIEDDRGYKVLPSVVSSRGEGRYIVGQAAHNLILTHPDRTVYATKRLIGRRFDSPEVQRALQRMQYQVREAPDGGVLLRIGDEWMSPTEVAAVILQVAKTITEKAIGEAVDEAVVTVPAHFNNRQREETLEAARMAGFRCDRLLNEPTAAALAYGHRKNIDRTVVIFDLGGGTFDVTVLRLAQGVYEVLATSGDTWLGGEDFDYRVVDHLADAFQARTGHDLRGDRNALQRVKDAAERAKCDLSFSDRTNVVIPHIAAGQNLETVLTRSTLESLTGDLISRCLDITRTAVADAGLPLSDVDEVVLVGGQTRMPRVREAVSGLFGREPSRSVHPEEAVAVGAAVHAASLGDASQPQTVLLDVTPFDLGIDSSGGIFSAVIARNSRVPGAETRTFATAHDDQTSVRITVRQGESRVAAENEFLGEFVLEGLTPAKRMQSKVDVTFKLDSNGILHVSAVDRASGEQRAISVRNYAERAKEARMPTAEEAANDDAARQARADADAKGRAKAGPAAAAPAPVGAGTKKKGGLLAAIFGSGGSKPKADPKAKAGKGTAAPVGAEAAAPAAAPVEPTVANAPAIDLSAVPDVVEPEALDAEEIDDDAAFAQIAEEEDLYGRVGGANIGLGGARLPAPRPETAPVALEPDEALDASDLFGSLDEDVEDPPTDARRRIPPPQMIEEVGEPVSLDGPHDPFGHAADEGVLFGESSGPTGLTFEGLFDGDEGILADEPGLGESDADRTGAFALDESDAFAVPEDLEAELAGLDLGEFEVDLHSAPPGARTLPAPEPPRAEPPRPAAFAFAPEPARPSPAAQAIALGTPGVDPFATGDGGAATALPADLFADDVPMDEPVGASSAPVLNPFDESPTSAGLRPPAMSPPPRVVSAAPPDEQKRKKPARLKLHYRDRAAFVVEYRDNLRRGGSFIKTEKPLSIGRDVIFEIDAPGLTEPLAFEGIVTYVSDGRDGQPPGMGVDYRLDADSRARLARAVGR